MNLRSWKVAQVCSLLLLTASSTFAADLVPLPTGTPIKDVEASIAVNPDDPCDAVAVWFTGSFPRRGWYATTRDGWETTPYIGEYLAFTNPFDLSVAYDAFTGAFWACYIAGSDRDVVYAKSSFDGNGDLVFLSENQVVVQTGNQLLDKPWIAVGGRPGKIKESNLYVPYSDPQSGEFDIKMKRSVSDCPLSQQDANGRCWEPEQDLGVDGGGVVPLVSPTRPEIVYMAYLAWASSNTLARRIEISKSADTGATFDPPLVLVNLNVVEPTIFPPGVGLAPCIAGRPDRIRRLPSIAAKVGTRMKEQVFVVWADVNFDSPGCGTACGSVGQGGPGDVDIYFARLTSSTTDSQMSVNPGFPKVIVTDPIGSGEFLCADQWYPWMTVDGAGTIHVVFYENRNTPDNLDPSACGELTPPTQRADNSCAMTHDLYHVSSSDNGNTWSTPQRITTDQEGGSSFMFLPGGLNYFMGDYVGVSANFDSAQSLVLNAAFPRDLDSTGDPDAQEMYVGKIDAAVCPP